MMTLDIRTAETLAKEAASRAGERAQRLDQVNDRFDRLVKAGAVQPEKYKIAPINPSSMANFFVIS